MNSIWLEIRNSHGHLFFKYDPVNNQVEIRRHSKYPAEIFKLDDIRKLHGVMVDTPDKLVDNDIVVIQPTKPP